MRALVLLTPFVAATQDAFAHTLDGDATLGQEILHQLAGTHHLPLLLIAAIGLVVAAFLRRRKDRH